MKQILFVCTGNSCRSPMAELYFNHCCRCSGRNAVRAVSAGVAAADGEPISPPAFRVMSTFGIDASGFHSRQLTAELVRNSELVVAMTPGHRLQVLELVPEAAGKTRLLLEFAGAPEPVPDPFGGGDAFYAAVFSRMRPALEALAEKFMPE